MIAARAFLIGLLLGAIDSVVNHVPWWLGEIGPGGGAVLAGWRPGWAGTIAGLVVPVGAATQMVVRPPAAGSAMALPVRFTVWIGAALAAALVARRHASSG